MSSLKKAESEIIKVDIDSKQNKKPKDLRQICTRNTDVCVQCALYSTDIPVG